MWEGSAQLPRERIRRVQVCASAHWRAHAAQLCSELLLLLLPFPSASLSSLQLLLRATTDTTALPTDFQSHLSQPAEPIAPRLFRPHRLPLPRCPASVLLQTAVAATDCAGSGNDRQAQTAAAFTEPVRAQTAKLQTRRPRFFFVIYVNVFSYLFLHNSVAPSCGISADAPKCRSSLPLVRVADSKGNSVSGESSLRRM